MDDRARAYAELAEGARVRREPRPFQQDGVVVDQVFWSRAEQEAPNEFGFFRL